MKRLLTFIGLFISVTTFAAAPLIWESSQYGKFLTTYGFKLNDDKQYRTLSVDPSAGGGVSAPIGSVGARNNGGSGEFWVKVGGADTSWQNVLTIGSGWSLLGNAGTSPGTHFLGTTDAQDLVFKTNGTERFRITSSGNLDTTLSTGLLHSDASGILSSSTLVDADVSNSAAIARSKIAAGTANHVVINDASGNLSSEARLSLTRFKDGTANYPLIANGAGSDPSYQQLVDAGVSSSAAIGRSKLASGTANHVLINDGTGVMSSEARLDLSRTKDGTANYVLTANGLGSDPSYALIGDSNISGTAAISRSKVASGTANHVLINDGSGNLSSEARLALSRTKDGTANYLLTAQGAGSDPAYALLTDSSVSASAAISFSKLATLTSGNILVGNGSNVATSVAMSGDVTISNTGATAIGNNKVTNSMLAQMATHTIKGNKTGSTADAADLSGTEVTALLDNVVGDSGSGGTKGLVPAPASGDAAAGKFLKADGSWAAPSGGSYTRTEVTLDSLAGTGSTNNNVARFTNKTDTYAGSDLTVTQSSINGDSITINTDGLYNVSGGCRTNSSQDCSVTVNSTGGAGSSTFPTGGSLFYLFQNSASTGNMASSRTLYLTNGSVIRMNTINGASGTGGWFLSVARVR